MNDFLLLFKEKYESKLSVSFLVRLLETIMNMDKISNKVKEEYYMLYIRNLKSDIDDRKILNHIFTMESEMRDRLANFFISSYFNRNKFDIIKFDKSRMFIDWVD